MDMLTPKGSSHSDALWPPENEGQASSGSSSRSSGDHKLPLSLPEYARYGRQMILPDFGLPAQLRLRNSRVLVVGAGGLGCPAVQYLAAAGVGHISIVDHDSVERSNLARQILHNDARVGMNKAESVAIAAKDINPHITVTPHKDGLSSVNALELVASHDLVLDCTDNPLTRYLISDAAVMADVQVVSGAAQGYEGQLLVLHKILSPSNPASAQPRQQQQQQRQEEDGNEPKIQRGPCYRCLFPQAPRPEEVTDCEDGGVLGGVTGLVGTMQALEAVKILARIGEETQPTMTLVQPLSGCPFRTIRLRPRRHATCRSCGDPSLVGREKMIGDLQTEDYVGFCGLAPKIDGVQKEPISRVGAKELANVVRTRDTTERQDFSQSMSGSSLEAATSEASKASTLSIDESTRNRIQAGLSCDDDSLPTSEKEATHERNESRVLILDVRPEIEYGITKLPDSINIPIAMIRRDPSSALSSLLQRASASASTVLTGSGDDRMPSLNTVVPLSDTSSSIEDKNRKQDSIEATRTRTQGQTVYVVCRRGNDSQQAVRLLNESVASDGTTIHFADLVGGLRSWAAVVDPEFPVY